MFKHSGTFRLVVLMAITTGMYIHADITVQTENRTSVTNKSSKESKNVETLYARGMDRRRETKSSLGSTTAIIAHCNTREGYFLDLDRKEYYKFTLPKDAMLESSNGVNGPHTVQSEPDRSGIRIISKTTEVNRPTVILAHMAKHFITDIKKVSATGVIQASEVIDGWYLAEFPSVNTNCVSEDMHESAWVSSLISPTEQVKVVQTGPEPKGLAVRLKITRTTPSNTPTTGDAAANVIFEKEVREISDRPLDPALFQVPKDFKEITRPRHPQPK